MNLEKCTKLSNKLLVFVSKEAKKLDIDYAEAILSLAICNTTLVQNFLFEDSLRKNLNLEKR
jgi:hypothetical protein